MSRIARRRAPTVLDVARAAGVARATAARVLGDYGSVRPELRIKVLEAADAVGYQPNRLARSMVSGATRTIGAVIADIGNPFFAVAVRGISDVVREAGFEVVLVNSDEDIAEERAAVQVLVEKQVDGLIVAPAPDGDSQHLARVRVAGTPMVLLDRNIPELDSDAVIVDGLAAGAEATSSLLGLGHERIAIVTDVAIDDALRDLETARASVQRRGTAAMRLVGYLTALHDANVRVMPELVRRAAPTVEGARIATVALLESEEPPTALFTTDNVMTLGAFEALQARGLRVPDDISLFGFDDPEWASIVRPPVSVVAQPVYELGSAAARRLLARLNGDDGPTQTVVLSTELVLRGSTGRPPRESSAASDARRTIAAADRGSRTVTIRE